MAAYCDFNEMNGEKVVSYHLQGMSTNIIFKTNYKYENHVYWQTKVIFTLM